MFSPRRWTERLARGRSFWRRLPPEFGHAPLRVSPDAALKFLKPGRSAIDPMLLRLAEQFVKSDDVVWDVGANVGIFSLACAQRGAQVLALEPDPWLCALLRSTGAHPANRSLHLEPVCVAIAAKAGTARLAIAARGRASNFLEKYDGRSDAGWGGGERIRHSLTVPVLTLDCLLSERAAPHVVKIDVEGAEADVLNGAKKLLSEIRPTMLIEIGETTQRAVIDKLRAANYRLFDYEADVEISRAPMQSQATGANILARPK